MGRSREFIAFSAISAVAVVSITLWQTLLPLYLNEKGFEPWQVGLAVTLAVNLSYLFAFPSGYVVDRLDWRRSLLAALLLSMAAPIVLGLVRSFTDFLAVAVLAGLSSSLITQSSVKVLVRSGTRRRGLMYSGYIFLSNAGRILGSFASGFIAVIYGYPMLFLAAAIILLPTLALLRVVHEAPSQSRGGSRVSMYGVARMYMRDTRLKILAATLFLHDFSVFIAIPYLALYAKYVIGLDEIGVGVLSGTSSTTQLLLQLFSGILVDKIGGSLTLALHFLGISAVYVAYSHVTQFLPALVTYAFMGFFITLDLPARRFLITKYAPEEMVGAINGFADTIAGIGTMFSAPLGGILWSISPSMPILAGGLLNLSTIPFILYLKHRKIRKGGKPDL